MGKIKAIRTGGACASGGALRVDHAHLLAAHGSFEAFVGDAELHRRTQFGLEPHRGGEVNGVEAVDAVPAHESPHIREARGINGDLIVRRPPAPLADQFRQRPTPSANQGHSRPEGSLRRSDVAAGQDSPQSLSSTLFLLAAGQDDGVNVLRTGRSANGGW